MHAIPNPARVAGPAILTVILVACSASASESPSETAAGSPAASIQLEPETVTIGFTASQTGRYNVESTRQLNGLQLWMDAVNDVGGLPLADGTLVTFEATFYDDESNGDRIQELYTKLINEDEADFLISPYSSGLADTAAVIAEQYGKILITTGAASDGTYQKGYTFIYQTYTPASRYLTGALDLLTELDSGATNLAIVHENDKFSSDVSAALAAYATAQGYELVVNEGYDTGATDFAPFINKIEAAGPDAIMGGGHFADTSTFAKQLYEKGLDANLIALLVAPPEPSFVDIGDAAIGIMGPSQWEPGVLYSEEAAAAAGTDWLGPTVDEFTSAYTDAYGEEPSYHAAGGYAAGLILQAAMEAAGSTDPDEVKAAMDGLNLMSFFGLTKFDTSAEAHGLQVGHEMVYIQWQGSSGDLSKEIVWPEEAKSADAIYPIP
jgi:ABC-type branched-subunit amino acid transport system substrate-binding protein